MHPDLILPNCHSRHSGPSRPSIASRWLLSPATPLAPVLLQWLRFAISFGPRFLVCFLKLFAEYGCWRFISFGNCLDAGLLALEVVADILERERERGCGT